MQMTITTTPAYIATVGDDHTIVLPEEIPVGARVTITVIPSVSDQQDGEARSARFSETLAAIQAAANARTTPPAISDAELDALIKKARKASQSK
jgi:predicted SPOUT superfamily RNA methylase MTH1